MSVQEYPGPVPEDERGRLANLIDKALDGDCGYGVGDHLAAAILAAGFARQPLPTREQIAEAIFGTLDGRFSMTWDWAQRCADSTLALLSKEAGR